MDAPPGVPGVSKNQKDKRINNLVCFCANIQPKLNKLWKTVRKQSFLIDFLDFMKFFEIWSIWAEYLLAQKHIKVLVQQHQQLFIQMNLMFSFFEPSDFKKS